VTLTRKKKRKKNKKDREKTKKEKRKRKEKQREAKKKKEKGVRKPLIISPPSLERHRSGGFSSANKEDLSQKPTLRSRRHEKTTRKTLGGERTARSQIIREVPTTFR